MLNNQRKTKPRKLPHQNGPTRYISKRHQTKIKTVGFNLTSQWIFLSAIRHYAVQKFVENESFLTT